MAQPPLPIIVETWNIADVLSFAHFFFLIFQSPSGLEFWCCRSVYTDSGSRYFAWSGSSLMLNKVLIWIRFQTKICFGKIYNQKIIFLNIKNRHIYLLKPLQRAFRLSSIKFLHCILFGEQFWPARIRIWISNPDPMTQLNLDPIRIHNTVIWIL